jgi:hypothetical protein
MSSQKWQLHYLTQCVAAWALAINIRIHVEGGGLTSPSFSGKPRTGVASRGPTDITPCH